MNSTVEAACGPCLAAAMAESVMVYVPRDIGSEDALARWRMAESGTPFDAVRLDVLDSLAQAIRRHPHLRSRPECASLAFWLRRANFTRYRDRLFATQRADEVLVPVGRVFHIAPANVDTMFLYSWALAFACGNQSVVRVSSRPSDITSGLLETLAATLDDYPESADIFLTHDHDARITSYISAACDQRIVWGGNETVAAIRQVPLSPHASERSFASKRSFALLEARRVLLASPDEVRALATNFFGDLFTFDQQACSSPQVIFWVGTPNENDQARRVLEDALQAEAVRRSFQPALTSAVRRVQHAFESAIDTAQETDWSYSAFLCIQLDNAAPLPARSCAGGVLRHRYLERLADLVEHVGREDQTISYFGFSADALHWLAEQAGRRGVDRIVPIGQALAFDPSWDAIDLLRDLTRTVVLAS